MESWGGTKISVAQIENKRSSVMIWISEGRVCHELACHGLVGCCSEIKRRIWEMEIRTFARLYSCVIRIYLELFATKSDLDCDENEKLQSTKMAGPGTAAVNRQDQLHDCIALLLRRARWLTPCRKTCLWGEFAWLYQQIKTIIESILRIIVHIQAYLQIAC